jgi:adenylate cyclase
MTSDQIKRKLAAILSADVKGYSRLMGEDEEWTLRTLKTYKGLIRNLVGEHRGRIVGGAGDSILAEFASVVDAVECAVEIQQVLRAKNAILPETRKMDFRIGINLGDVIEEEDSIYGDGVNIAALLEGLAEPGGICISGSAYEQIENKIPLRYDYLGEHEVKNIAKPVRVYKAQIETEVASKEKMAYPLPDLPSIAVLPFVNMSDDPKQEFFCDGITEEIITALSKVPRLFVIARTSTFTYKGKPVKIKQVSEELGVRYVLEGSLQKSGDRIRITAQLIDAITEHHIWAERYDRDLKDLFALQDEITIKILTAMQVELTEGEGLRSINSDSRLSLDCHLKLLEAANYLLRFNIEDYITARRLTNEAISLCPSSPRPYVLLGWITQQEGYLGNTKSPQDTTEKAFELAKKALAMDDSFPGAHTLLGYIYTFKKEYDRAIAEEERAVALNPNGAETLHFYAMVLLYAGMTEEAIPFFQKAIRLNPNGPPHFFHGLGRALQNTGRYDEAVSTYKKAIQRAHNNNFAHAYLASTYSLIGREKEARAEVEEVLRINPKFSLAYLAKNNLYKDQSSVEKYLINPLRKAGLK